MPPRVRPATSRDPLPELLYLSAAPQYDRYLAGRERALRILGELAGRGGHAASASVCSVAEVEGVVAGVLAGFPVADEGRMTRKFLRLALPRVPVTHWPALARCVWVAGRISPVPPSDAWYVDALAVGESFRRQGLARALLEEAERRARDAGLTKVALDTSIDNLPAQALYEAFGFEEFERSRADPRAGEIVGTAGFVGYVKPL